MTLSIYVAGASAEVERAEVAIAMLRAAGWRITYDWTRDVRRARAQGCATDADLSEADARHHATVDVEAVRDSNALLFLAPSVATRGAWVEFGVALCSCTHIVVAGSEAASSIFLRLADATYPTDVEAVAALGAMAAEGARAR